MTDISLRDQSPRHLCVKGTEIKSEKERVLIALRSYLSRFRWEVPLAVALGCWHWLNLQRAHETTFPPPREGSFGRWFWQSLTDQERESFLDCQNGQLPPPLARTMVRLLVVSLGIKTSLWKLESDELALMIEEAQTALFSSGSTSCSDGIESNPQTSRGELVECSRQSLPPPAASIAAQKIEVNRSPSAYTAKRTRREKRSLRSRQRTLFDNLD